MSDNVLQTLQQLIQDVIAPDVRELKVRLTSLEKQMDVRFEALENRLSAAEKQTDGRFDAAEKRTDSRFDAAEKQSEAQFKAILAAIAESKAQAELTNFRVIAALSERVAVLEAQRH